MRLTENAVMVDQDGTIAYVRAVIDPNGTNNKKKLRDIVRTDNGEVTKTAKILTVNSIDSLMKFVTAFNGLGVKERSGYDNYVNAYGPTNPESPRDFDSQGLLKIIVIFLNALHEKIAKGGAEGADAKNMLALITEYNAVAHETIILAEEDALLQLAARRFTPEQIAAAQSKIGANIPPATVDASEANDVETEEPAVA